MREVAILSRRAAAALPLAALLGPVAAAVPATAVGDDAALIDLGWRWEAVLAAERAHDKTFFVDEPMSAPRRWSTTASATSYPMRDRRYSTRSSERLPARRLALL